MTEAFDALLAREQVTEQKRAWIRLTRACNNRCLFCLDTKSNTGVCIDEDRVRADIDASRKTGATRLILSGGEATIHPRFVQLVRYARTAGFQEIQSITNGRMFSYPRFLAASVDAGLTEITFSMHGHTAELHDRLVGVDGAFAQALAGLESAVRSRSTVVNVDICLNRLNVDVLPDILAFYAERGVREFDLLHLIPFGRAYEADVRDVLAYDVEAAAPRIEAAILLAKQRGLHIWFNRFPPAYLEGYEELIQDPHKILDEARGAYEGLDTMLRGEETLYCEEPERCLRCYLNGFCSHLRRWRDRLANRLSNGDGFDALRVDHTDTPPPALSRLRPGLLWVRAPNAQSAAAAASRFPARGLILELEQYDDLAAEAPSGALADKPIVRVIVRTPSGLKTIEEYAVRFEVVVPVTPPTLRLFASGAPLPPRLVITRDSPRRASSVAAAEIDLLGLMAGLPNSVPVEAIPACLTGRRPRQRPRVLELAMLRRNDDVLRLDVMGSAAAFEAEHFTTKSRRCAHCVERPHCGGVHVNWVRGQGYAKLRPLAAVHSTTLPDVDQAP